MNRVAIARLGMVSLLLILLLLAASFPLHCVERAAVVGGGALLAGGGMGFAMAMITRTRRPILIYLWLALMGLSLWPLYAGWPPGGPWEIHPWPHAPDLVYNYFDILRSSLFILAFPWVFARLGYHAPDPLPPPTVKYGLPEANFEKQNVESDESRET